MEYSKDIGSLLGNPKSPSGTVIEDRREVVKVNLGSASIGFSNSCLVIYEHENENAINFELWFSVLELVSLVVCNLRTLL